uniref:Serine-threonine/tyrosine-protein kinase catalytic domain-containing protein n=1 Tax=Oryza meridionalis TaxID=40149 RepID=A0A0E0C9A3_9ORYZ
MMPLQSVIDLAMSCVENTLIDRPSMTDIVIKLKECLPAGTGEKQLVSRSYKQKDTMNSDMARKFQLLISGVSIESNEGQRRGIHGWWEIGGILGREWLGGVAHTAHKPRPNA